MSPTSHELAENDRCADPLADHLGSRKPHTIFTLVRTVCGSRLLASPPLRNRLPPSSSAGVDAAGQKKYAFAPPRGIPPAHEFQHSFRPARDTLWLSLFSSLCVVGRLWCLSVAGMWMYLCTCWCDSTWRHTCAGVSPPKKEYPI